MKMFSVGKQRDNENNESNEIKKNVMLYEDLA